MCEVPLDVFCCILTDKCSQLWFVTHYSEKCIEGPGRGMIVTLHKGCNE